MERKLNGLFQLAGTLAEISGARWTSHVSHARFPRFPSSIYWINFTFPGQICALSSPYSFSNSPTTCGVLPTQIPASNIGSAASDNLVLLTAGGGLAVTSGVTANYGDHFVLQAPQAGASDTGITADGIKMARNHFFSVR